MDILVRGPFLETEYKGCKFANNVVGNLIPSDHYEEKVKHRHRDIDRSMVRFNKKRI
jgi:hypothetical protein